MTITYDAEKKRATHVESGLAVEFVREGLYAQEQERFFKLFWSGYTIGFSAVYNNGFSRLNDENPNWSAEKLRRKVLELNENNHTAGSFDLDIKQFIRNSPEFPEIFLKVWLRVVSEIFYWKRCSVHLKPYFNPSDGEWSLQADEPLRPLETDEELAR